MPATQQALQQARDADWVDYSTVTTLEITTLRVAWKGFVQRDDGWITAPHWFVAEQDDSLFRQAALDTLHAQQVKGDEMRWGRPARPEMYQNVDSPEVRQFCEEYCDDVDFYLWLQWLAYGQFVAYWEISQGYEMSIGLYRDLAVDVAEGGAEAWRDHELYCPKVSVDMSSGILSPLGQNWGLPPMDPHITATRTYESFIELLRANMQNCGALRTDHVTSMSRLWWILYGETADQDAYVHYPVDDLSSILAPESKRHRCIVISEDLDTVSVGIVDKLRSSGAYSYKVLYFENDHKETLRSPKAYPEQSTTVATTYDLSTLRGYWEGRDLALGKTLGLYPDEMVLRGLYQDRELAKQGLLGALHKYGYLPRRVGHKASLMSVTPTLNRGLQCYIAGSDSTLLGLQPED